MSEIALIGEKDFLFPLRALGVSTYPVGNSEEVLKILTQLIQEECPLILLTETYIKEIIPKINQLCLQTKSAITIIPGASKRENIALEHLKKISEKAVGVNLFK